jgi:uncharacterized repeat protein (TIGR01451 family)
MLTVLAAAVSAVLLVCGVAAADTVTSNFEPPTFQPGTVNGQDGWKSAVPGNIPSLPNGYDQAVVVNTPPAPAAFGSQSLRMSNAYNPAPEHGPLPEYHYQTYSKPTPTAAGEELANKEYIGQFSFISIDPDHQQPGLKMDVSPDMGEGARMSYIGLRDVEDGIAVTFFDTNADGDFVGYDLGILPRNAVHTIRFWMKLNPGPDNDLVRILIDGRDVGDCFTTWENFYRATDQGVQISDRMLFRSTGPQVTQSLVGGGYLFDDVTTTTANGPGPPGCDVEIDKDADKPTVTAGGRVGYQITVRNRGRLAARRLRVCDHLPRRMTFVSADRRLRRLGRLRCLTIPSLRPGRRVSFHLTAQVNADAPPGSLPNIADIIPDLPALPRPPAGDIGLPPSAGRPPAVVIPPRAIVRARAIVRILKRVKAERAQRRARPARTRPPFTG